MMALTLRCEFTLFHAGEAEDGDEEWALIPGVREVLERWGYLEKGSPRSAVFQKVAVRVRKVYIPSRNATGELAKFLADEPVDLVVVGTNGHDGPPPWLLHSMSHRLSQDTRTMTMFVPSSGGAAAFSNEETVEMDMLHVGEETHVPCLALPERDYLRWQFLMRPGNVPDQILRAACERKSDLIAMTTDGTAGLLGALRGSVTERIVRNASCPVLAVPA
jgi:nucleotide-binding universal stress UspA family protein